MAPTADSVGERTNHGLPIRITHQREYEPPSLCLLMRAQRLPNAPTRRQQQYSQQVGIKSSGWRYRNSAPASGKFYTTKGQDRSFKEALEMNLPVLKDPQSAGVTLALKNMSHGLVNNVSRSHGTQSLNACNLFIPAAVQLPAIRNKAVLHILDGVKGVYHGGPSARPEFVWEHNTLYFATDPVSLDHVGWEVIDAKRVSVGMKKLAEDAPDQVSTFVRRQPEHVEI